MKNEKKKVSKPKMKDAIDQWLEEEERKYPNRQRIRKIDKTFPFLREKPPFVRLFNTKKKKKEK